MPVMVVPGVALLPPGPEPKPIVPAEGVVDVVNSTSIPRYDRAVTRAGSFFASAAARVLPRPRCAASF